MFRSVFHVLPFIALASVYASGCKGPASPSAKAPPTTGTTEASAPKAKPKPVNLAVDKPNELGRIPVLEYHHIEAKEDRWTRTPANFRKDLERLYKLEYRPIAMNDYVAGKIDTPPGKTPVIFTFDDSDPGQFRYQGTGASAKLDPNCAVAMLLDFNKTHPDFPAKATFYVLPSLFGQREFEERKLKELVKWGFEIGNHTFTHPPLRKLSREAGIKELAKDVGVIKKILPDYDVKTMALPLGSIPKDDSILHGGTAEGITYRHNAALLVGAEPAPSPFSKRFKPFRIPRIQATETVQPSLDYWLKAGEKSPGTKFRSDGDPNTVTFPKAEQQYLNSTVVKKRRLRTY